MPRANRRQIQEHVRNLLENAPGGVRWSDLLKATHAAYPETPQGSIQGATRDLLLSNRDIIKVAPGTYRLARYQQEQSDSAIAQGQATSNTTIEVIVGQESKVTLAEADFYDSFAQWLIDAAEEVNVAIALGGNVLKGKWGTPDVIGVLRPRMEDIIKFEPQVVSAEIKIDPSQPVVAFGQAIAYRLFSHKSYIVVPNTTNEDDLSRLKALRSIHGVGLVVFTLDKQSPDYTSIVPPALANPDWFYTNQTMRRLLDGAPKLFAKLFP